MVEKTTDATKSLGRTEDDGPSWRKATIERSLERASKFETLISRARFQAWQLPWPVTRKGVLEGAFREFGLDAAADLLLCARLRIAASLLALVAGACFLLRATPAVVIGSLVEATALLAAYEAHRRLRRSGVPLSSRRRIPRWLPSALRTATCTWRRERHVTPTRRPHET